MLAIEHDSPFAGKVHRAQKIRIDGFLPVFERSGKKPLGWRASRVGYTDVHRPKLLSDRGDEALNGARIGDVKRIREDFNFVLLPYPLRVRGKRLLIAGTHCDAATLRCERFRRGQSQSLAGSGHQGYSVPES